MAPGGRFLLRSGKVVPEQSDFAQHYKLLCINPSVVLADATSLYTREALVPSSSERAVEHHSLLPRGDGLPRQCEHWLAMTRWKIGASLHRAIDNRPYRMNPSVGTADISPFRGD